MSVASADAALLSAARAYASLKMINRSPSSSSSSTPTTVPPSQSPPVATPKSHGKPIHYSRQQLLALQDSPLCVRPAGLKPLKDWFGECDPSSVKPQAQTSNPNNLTLPHPPHPQRVTNPILSPTDHSRTSSTPSSLPVLGRSQPPARNPFANFGKFGAEEPSANSFNLLNSSASSLHTNHKPSRRVIDREQTNQVGRGDHNSISDNARKRNNDSTSTIPSKDRLPNNRHADHPDQLDFKGSASNRRVSDRYGHDRDREDDRPRDREVEKDRERDKTGGRNGDEHLNWRRQPNSISNSSSLHPTQKRSGADHQSHPRDKDSRAKDSSRDNDRGKTGAGASRSNQQVRPREREKENALSKQSSISLTPYDSSKPQTSPLSPSATSAYAPTKRIKDGAWDEGEGKWEMTKPSAGDHHGSSVGGGGGGYGATSETDAIQAWKAEMKALEAKKRQAAEATSHRIVEPESPPHRSNNTLDSSLTSNSHSTQPSLDLSHTQKTLTLISAPRSAGITPEDATQGQSSKSLSFVPLANHSGVISTEIDDVAIAPRASRFAKFFDNNHKDDAPHSQRGDLAFKSTNLPGHASSADLDSDQAPKTARSPSADPENMARVLSMLQMSSQQNLDPPQNFPSQGQAHVSQNQSIGKLLPPSAQSRSPLDLSNFQHHQPQTSPKANLAQSMTFPGEDRSHPHETAHHSSQMPNTFNRNSTSPFNVFPNAAHPLTQQTAPMQPSIRELDELAGHHASLVDHHKNLQHSNHLEGFGPTAYHTAHHAGVQPGHHNELNLSHPPNMFGGQPKPLVEPGFGGLRASGSGMEPQLFQLQHMLNTVSGTPQVSQHNLLDRNLESQKLAFLARQLQQQRMSPAGHPINPTNLNPMQTAPMIGAGAHLPIQIHSRVQPEVSMLGNNPNYFQEAINPALGVQPTPTGLEHRFITGYNPAQTFHHPVQGIIPAGVFGPPPPPPPQTNMRIQPPNRNTIGGYPFGAQPPQQPNGQLDLMSLLNAGQQRRIGM